MRLGFFGGSFNPPHEGHKRIIEYCSKKFDKFLVIPNYNSPETDKEVMVSYEHRCNMLKLQLKRKKIYIDDYEAKSNQTNYTYLTIQYLKKKYKEYDIYMILGKDQLNNLANWCNLNFILDNVKLICFDRKIISNKNKQTYDVEYIDFKCSISSTDIREKIKMGKSISCDIINAQVLDYIKENNLYI